VKFCSDCGSAQLVQRIPDGDNRQRTICEQCHTIHYDNPKVIVGCLPVWEDRVLLCKRAIEPRYGLWTLPAGFMEHGESTEQGAMRETWEEAQAKVEDLHVHSLFSVLHITQVYIIYRARLSSLDFAAGIESLEVALFKQQDIPWDGLAFPAITQSLQDFFSDREQGHYQVHVADLAKRAFDH